MSQQINLLNPALIKQKNYFSPTNIVALLGILLTGMLGYFFYENQDLDKLVAKRDGLSKEIASIKTVRDELILKKSATNQNNALNIQIEALKEKRTMQNEVITTVNQNKSTQGSSYAGLMRALSKQSIEGLWITGLSIDQNAQHLSISGRTLNADLVPKFIARLRAEPALKGKTFTDLTMQSHVQAMEKSTNKLVTDNQSTIEINSNIAKQTPSGPKFIEFTLKSMPSEQADAINKTIDVTPQLSVVN